MNLILEPTQKDSRGSGVLSAKTDFASTTNQKDEEQTETNNLDKARYQALNEALLTYMKNEKPYLDSELNLVDLAKNLSVT